jgi:hypothetical protein
MSEDKIGPRIPPSKPANIEERGVDLATVASAVSAGAAVVSAGVSIYTTHQNKPSKPSEPPLPSIELPPGVNRE